MTSKIYSPQKIFEGAGYALELLAWIGAVSGTALFVFLGKVLMAVVFLFFMVGVVIRIRRGRRLAKQTVDSTSGA